MQTNCILWNNLVQTSTWTGLVGTDRQNRYLRVSLVKKQWRKIATFICFERRIWSSTAELIKSWVTCKWQTRGDRWLVPHNAGTKACLKQQQAILSTGFNGQLKPDPSLSPDIEKLAGIQKGLLQIHLGKTQQGLQNPKTSAESSPRAPNHPKETLGKCSYVLEL